MTRARAVSVAFLAAAVLGALASAASANHLRMSSTTFRATWTSFEFAGGFGTSRCNLTLEGSLRSATISKVLGAEIGSISAGTVGSCPTGSATILRETLPWRIRYESFTGTLPAITSVTANVVGGGFQIREPTFGITCLATSTESLPIRIIIMIEPHGAVIGIQIGGRVATNCGADGTFSGRSSTNSAMTITLI